MGRFRVQHATNSRGTFTEVFDLRMQSVTRIFGLMEPSTAVAFVLEARRLRDK